MPRRQLSSIRNRPSASSRKLYSKRWNWFNRLFALSDRAGEPMGVPMGVPKALGVGLNYRLDLLEPRRLFTTFTGIDPTTGAGVMGNMVFYSDQHQVSQITFFDCDFEAVGSTVNTTTGAITLGNLIPAANPEPPQGTNIYKIFVTESHADSFITIENLASLANPVPVPFDGAIPALAVSNAQTGAPYATQVPGGTGGILIGDYDPTTKPIPNTPFLSVPLTNGLGLQPATQGLVPGIEVIPVDAATQTPNDFGQFFVGGTVTGNVSFGGNLSEFYAGAVLTGDTLGDPSTPPTPQNPPPTSLRTAPNNFTVAGDLRDFITTGPVGTDGTGTAAAPNYVTSFDLSVGGKLGFVHVGNAEHGDANASFAGTIEAGNSPLISGQTAYPTSSTTNLIGIQTDQTELENLAAPNPDTVFPGTTDADGNPIAGLDLQNGTIADAEMLFSIPELDPVSGLPVRDADGNIIYQASVDGGAQVNTDTADFYEAPFMAGVTFQVTANGGSLTVFDPDGREIASNTESGTGPLQIKTDRPGLYRFEITNFSTYNLTVTNVGNMGIGGIVIAQNFNDIGIDSAIIAGNGDLGVIQVGGTYISTTTGPTPATSGSTLPSNATPPVVADTSILVADGNLRDLTTSALGIIAPGGGTPVLEDGPTLSVPNGSVGLVQSTVGVMNLECQYDPNFLGLTTPVFKTDDDAATAIGGSIQVIDAATIFQGNIATNAGIGTIRAGNMATATATHIEVNADNKGFDGIIDLVDVSGQFGILGAGPEFLTHDGGNIRYMNIGGPIFLPAAFGGLQDDPVTYPAGSTNTFTDDSGATFTFTAEGPVTTTTINNSNGTTTQQSAGTVITVLTYPVLDKAGLVPLSITAADSAGSNGSAGSIVLNGSGADGAGSEIDVANISVTGVGRPITTLTTNSSTGVVTTPTDVYGNTSITQAVPTNSPSGVVTTGLTDPTDEFISITGPATFNVLNMTATILPAFQATNSPVEISNTTRGEIVNVTAPFGIGSIVVNGNLGFATPQSTAAAVYPRADIQDGNTYPFQQQHTGVVIGTGFVISDADPTSTGTTGDVVNIDVGGAAGNIEAGGTIQSLITNYAQSTGIKGVTPILGQIDGVVGPVLATRVLFVNVGQGLLPTGSGLVGQSGIFGTGKVGTVTNAGNPNGDIRGDIISAEDDAATNIGIDAITLINASIIGSTIETVDDFVGHEPAFIAASDLNPFQIATAENGLNFTPGQPSYTYDIGPITVSGLGGIIGADIESGSMASINVVGSGFGILSTTITGKSQGRLGSMSVSGYGIRDTDVESFGWTGPITLTGKGNLVPSTTYPLDVRPSDNANQLDPFFGYTPDKTIDINAVLGTSALVPNIPNRTDTGVFEDNIFNGLDDLTSLTAQKARSTLPLVTEGSLPTPDTFNVPAIGVVFGNSLTFGGTIGSVHIIQATDGLQITAGKLLSFSLSSNVNRVGISVAGTIKALSIRGNLGQFVTDPETGQLIPDSYINAGGPDGTIGSLTVRGNLNANIYATGHIGSITITGDLLGGILAYGKSNELALSSLHVFGGVRDGSLVLNGSVGSIIINRTFGTATGSLSIAGNANLISVGANHRLPNSQLALALFVAGTLKNLVVYGSITGTVHTGIDLTHMTVTNDGTTPNAITGNITVDGRLGSANIINGNITSNFVVAGSVGAFTITRGNLNAGASITSQLGAIQNFRTVGGTAYGVYGSLLAINGGNENIDISGNLGDGINPALITADSGNTFRIRGNVVNNAMIAVTNELNLLRVDGSVLTGATISAHPIKTQKIAGTSSGTIIAV